MKLLVQDNDGNLHCIFSKLELELSAENIGETVLDFVNFVEIESPRSSQIGRA